MARKLKVFGGIIFHGDPRTQVRTIVGAYTKKQAVELLDKVSNISMYHFNDYWCETGNSVELATATEVGIWISKDRFEKNFERII